MAKITAFLKIDFSEMPLRGSFCRYAAVAAAARQTSRCAALEMPLRGIFGPKMAQNSQNNGFLGSPQWLKIDFYPKLFRDCRCAAGPAATRQGCRCAAAEPLRGS
jgi:hypothetical protein